MKKLSVFSMAAMLLALVAVNPVKAADESAPVAAPAPAAAPASAAAPVAAEKAPMPMHHEEMKAKHDAMTGEDKAAHKAKMEEHMKSMPPEKQAEMKARHEKRMEHRKEMKAKWDEMTPEEKAAHKAKMKERFDSLPPEKQAEMKARHEKRMEHRKEMHEKHGGEHPMPMHHGKDDAKPVPAPQPQEGATGKQ